MTDFDKLHSGELYDALSEEIMQVQNQCLDLLDEYNHLALTDYEGQERQLKKMFLSVGENTIVVPPFFANWGGRFTTLGNHVYINSGLTMVDDTYITIGDDTLIGPNVTINCANHPLDPNLRGPGALQYNQPVTIGRNVWIGAGVIILAGVAIGDNSVIGAGSLVTKSIPENVLAYGSPCRVIRALDANRE